MRNSFDPDCPSTSAESDWLLFRLARLRHEKTRQMFADHGIGGKGQAEFLQSNSACLLRQVADRGLCEKAVENDLVKGGSIKVRRNGSGKEARAP